MTTYRLPFPPSVNGLYRNALGARRKRFKTKGYRAWIDEASGMLLAQKAKPFGKRCWLVIGLQTPDRRKRDASNLAKSCEDILVRVGVLPDDCRQHLRGTFIYWLDEPGKECVVTLVDAGETEPGLYFPSASQEAESEAA